MVMHVAVFADQLFYKQPGGIGTYLRELVPRLAEDERVDRLVLAHHGPRDADPFPGLEKADSRYLPGRRDVTGVLWHSLGRPFLERYVGKVDLVHAPSLVYPPSRAPLVATVHDLTPAAFPSLFPRRWRWFHLRGLHLILERAQVIMCDSKATLSDLRRFTGGRMPPARVVPLGVNPPGTIGERDVEEVLRKYSLEPGYLLFVGTLEPRKNLGRLVEAFSSLGEIHRRRGLVLVGARGWLGESELERILGVPGVRWLGFLPREELEAVYRGASVFVYPSLYEGFGLPVLEAMVRGLPVVTADVPALREVAEEAALLVDPEDEGEIRRAVKRLLEDGRLREDLAERGKEQAGKFPWSRTAGLTVEVYMEAMR